MLIVHKHFQKFKEGKIIHPHFTKQNYPNIKIIKWYDKKRKKKKEESIMSRNIIFSKKIMLIEPNNIEKE